MIDERRDDRETLRHPWAPPSKPRIPNGLDTPDLVAIRFVPTEGAFWDASGIEGVEHLLRAVKAAVMGDRLDLSERHGSVTV